MICGVVDGTLIEIDAPSENEAAFIDRNGHHSLNVITPSISVMRIGQAVSMMLEF